MASKEEKFADALSVIPKNEVTQSTRPSETMSRSIGTETVDSDGMNDEARDSSDQPKDVSSCRRWLFSCHSAHTIFILVWPFIVLFILNLRFLRNRWLPVFQGSVDEQRVLALQQDMNGVLERLNRLESQSAQGQKSEAKLTDCKKNAFCTVALVLHHRHGRNFLWMARTCQKRAC